MSELLDPCYKQKDARSFCDNTAKLVYTRGWIPVHSTTFPSLVTPLISESRVTWELQIFIERFILKWKHTRCCLVTPRDSSTTGKYEEGVMDGVTVLLLARIRSAANNIAQFLRLTVPVITHPWEIKFSHLRTWFVLGSWDLRNRNTGIFEICPLFHRFATDWINSLGVQLI